MLLVFSCFTYNSHWPLGGSGLLGVGLPTSTLKIARKKEKEDI